jgi:hypothetical protein
VVHRIFHRVLVLTSFACCALVALSFTMFARDQLAGASAHQQHEILTGNPPRPTSVPVQKVHGQPRRFIDDAARRLTSPFDSLVTSHNTWALRALPSLLALLVFGFGLGFLARYASGIR